MGECLIVIGAFMYTFAFMFTIRVLKLNGNPEDYKGVINLKNEEDEK